MYRIFSWLQVATAMAALFMGFVLKTDSQKWGPNLGDFFGWTQASAWWLVLAFGCVNIVARLVCFEAGPPWVWKSVQKFLEIFRKVAFEIADDHAVHEHRVTIFKRTTWLSWIWPFRVRYFP